MQITASIILVYKIYTSIVKFFKIFVLEWMSIYACVLLLQVMYRTGCC